MAGIRVADETSHESRGWLKEAAPLNVNTMWVTDDVFQEFRGWLKESALWNV